jgi:hypothetical protein
VNAVVCWQKENPTVKKKPVGFYSVILLDLVRDVLSVEEIVVLKSVKLATAMFQRWEKEVSATNMQ